MSGLTIEQVGAIMPSAVANGLNKEWPDLLETLKRYEINTKLRIAAFLANVAKESGELYYVEELADGWDYEGREDLGNTQEGDGPRFKGHGYIQITGRNNHRVVGQALGVDAENNPQVLTQIPYAWLSAGYYWRYMSSWGNLNEYADQEDFGSTVMGVRGGPDDDRWHYWYTALETLPDDLTLGEPKKGERVVTGQDIVEAARKLLEVWYSWWKEGDPIPKWWYEYGDTCPPRWWFDENGTMCADLINAARNYCGLPSIGGTPAYYDWAVANGGVNFDSSTPGVPGAICVNPGPWRGDTLLDQGHIALYTDEHTLIQATDGSGSFAGVNEGEQDYDSQTWAGYWTYALMPDVDYSADLGDDAPEPQPALTVPRWLAYNRDNWPMLDGPDWSKGFHWYDKDGMLLPQWKGPNDA